MQIRKFPTTWFYGMRLFPHLIFFGNNQIKDEVRLGKIIRWWELCFSCKWRLKLFKWENWKSKNEGAEKIRKWKNWKNTNAKIRKTKMKKLKKLQDLKIWKKFLNSKNPKNFRNLWNLEHPKMRFFKFQVLKIHGR